MTPREAILNRLQQDRLFDDVISNAFYDYGQETNLSLSTVKEEISNVVLITLKNEYKGGGERPLVDKAIVESLYQKDLRAFYNTAVTKLMTYSEMSRKSSAKHITSSLKVILELRL